MLLSAIPLEVMLFKGCFYGKSLNLPTGYIPAR